MRRLPLFCSILAFQLFLLSTHFLKAANSGGITLPKDSDHHVIGGEDADINEIPFMGALVWNDEGDNSRQFCTCTAISPYWVMTAAHCVDRLESLSDFKVIFGTADLTNLDAGLVYYAKTLILHPDHSQLYDDNYGDLALIQLSTPLPEWIIPISLNGEEDQEAPNNKARIAGWGRTSVESTSASDILQWAEVTLQDFETTNLSEFRRGRVNNTMLAAGEIEPYRSTYSGDSGGPLMVFDPDTSAWTQLGITSFSSGNKAENPISFFTRVSSHKAWIDNIVQNDFHHWLSTWNINALIDHDLDGYQPALEWILDQNPFEPDPDWSTQLEPRRTEDGTEFYAPLKIREFAPRLFLDLEKSTDLNDWDSTEFAYLNWDSITKEGEESPTYEIPILTEGTPGSFFRLRLDNLRGIYHGPLPLRMGEAITGSLGKAYNDTGLSPNGLIRYDFLLDTFGFSDPVYIDIDTRVLNNVWLYNLDTRNLETEFRSTQNSTLQLLPDGDQRYLLRIEREAGQSRTQSPLHVYADFSPKEGVHFVDEIVSGSLTQDDQPYVREGYYADRYYFDLDIEKMFKVSMHSETLDSAIVIKSDLGRLEVEEIDEETPGVTEEVLIYQRTFAWTEVLAGSWRFEETGDYTLEVKEYTEPSEVRPGDDFLGMTDPNDRSSSQNGTTFRLDGYDIKGFDASEGISITVDGVEDHSVAFAIFDNTERESVHQTGASSGIVGYFFNPEVGHEYELIIISREEFLGKNFRIKASNGNIFLPDDPPEEPDSLNNTQRHFEEPVYQHTF